MCDRIHSELGWSKDKPTETAWYFWKRTKTVTDSWKWKCLYYVAERNKLRICEHWRFTGKWATLPNGGWWSQCITIKE